MKQKFSYWSLWKAIDAMDKNEIHIKNPWSEVGFIEYIKIDNGIKIRLTENASIVKDINYIITEPETEFPIIVEHDCSTGEDHTWELTDDMSDYLNPFIDLFGKEVSVKWNEEVIDMIDEVNIPIAGMFIIPNHAGKAKDYLLMKTDKLIANMKAIAEANSVSYDPDMDGLVQIWMFADSKGMNIDNLQDHYPKVVDKDGNSYVLRFPYHLPINVCRLFKEGETRELILPGVGIEKYTKDAFIKDYNDKHLTTTVKLQITPAQTITRYRRFGNFEEVAEKVL